MSKQSNKDESRPIITKNTPNVESKISSIRTELSFFNDGSLPVLKKFHLFDSHNPLDYKKQFTLEVISAIYESFAESQVSGIASQALARTEARNEVLRYFMGVNKNWEIDNSSSDDISHELPKPFCVGLSDVAVSRYISYDENSGEFIFDHEAFRDDAIIFAETDREKETIDGLERISQILTRAGINPYMLPKLLQYDPETKKVSRCMTISPQMFYRCATNI